MLLAGYPPFHGSEQQMRAKILAGQVDWQHKHRWARVSQAAMHFVQSLLQTDPRKRLDVAGALNHEWFLPEMAVNHDPVLSAATLRSIGSYARAPSLKRAILQLLAKELAPSDVRELRRTFLELADDEEGTVSFTNLKDAIRSGVPQRESDTDVKTPSRKIRHAKTEHLKDIFQFMDANGDNQVYYSDFMAATMNENLALREEHVRAVFHRLDADHSGSISSDDIRNVIGDTFEGLDTSSLICDAETSNGEIDYESFMRVLGGACSRLQVRDESMESFGC
jgi:calcium-dependent protein kinase